MIDEREERGGESAGRVFDVCGYIASVSLFVRFCWEEEAEELEE